ncbi:hypothetical protein PS15m_003550 [Mucor circinelloides]
MIFTSKDGIGIGVGEVKPMPASNDAVEEDSIRILESLKKLLNIRVKYTRSTRELQTFGIMINGDKVQSSRIELTERVFGYNYSDKTAMRPDIGSPHLFSLLDGGICCW